MNPQALAQEIIDGRRLTRQDDLKAFDLRFAGIM